MDAALKAADADPTIAKDSSERLALLRSAFIPALAGVDRETHEPRRRVARISEMPEKARGLLNCLVDARLLATDSPPGAGETIIEPAHEALLRQWDALQGWLKEDSVALLMLEGIWQAAQDWADHDKSGVWLGHSAGRLEDAERLHEREDFARFIGPVEQAYLQACRAQENERRNRELEEARKLAEAQTKIAQRTRIGLIAASVFLVVAIGAAVFGFRQADIAKEQKTNAEQQTVIAKEQKANAEQQALKTEQRSAVLAANVARSLTAEGELDAALLLLLNGARWFDDASVPDELRIALTRALEKKSRIEVNMLFPNMQVFETDAALLLVNPATHDIFKLTDSLSPDRLVKGSTADSPILKLRQSAQGDDVIVLRKNLEVERINLATGMRRKVGVFPQPQAELGGRNEEELDGAGEAEITHNGLVVREFSYERPNGEWGDYAQIMDAGTGRIVEGELPFRVAVYGGAAADGAIYVVPANEEKAFRLKPGADGFLSQEARLDQNTTIQQRYGNCVGGLKGAVRTAVLEKISDSYNYPIMDQRGITCKKFGDKVLLTTFSSGSGGTGRYDTKISSDGAMEDVQESLSQKAGGGLNEYGTNWVGIQAKTGATGALSDRDVMVVDKSNSLILNYRHPTIPTLARFAGRDLLIVVEGESGWLVAHNLAAIPRRESPLFSTTTNDIIRRRDKRVTTLHRGTCVGSSMRDLLGDQEDVLPDGRKLVYENRKSEIRVMSDKSAVVVKLPKDESCWQFSANWRQMLVMQSNEVALYDFDRVVASGSLTGGEIGAIPVSNSHSAFFVPRTGDVVTSDGSNRVLLWEREESKGKWRSTPIDHKTVKTLWHESPVVCQGHLALWDYHAQPDRYEARLQVIQLYYRGWDKISIRTSGRIRTEIYGFDLNSRFFNKIQ